MGEEEKAGESEANEPQLWRRECENFRVDV